MRNGSFVVVIALLCVGVMSAQKPAVKTDTQAAYVPSLTFDVAVIRESKPSPQGWSISFVDPPHSSLLKLTNNDVWNLLEMAYGVNPAQLVGLPDWTRGFYAPHYNVEAKSDDSVDERLAKLSNEQARLEKQHMLQVLLADRFKLNVHWGTKEGPIYELVVAKNGPKLHPGGSMPPTPEERHDFGDRKIPPIYQRGFGVKGSEYVCHECSIKSLTEQLTLQMGTSVIDKTGLTGTYDFILRYQGPGPEASDDPSAWPPLLTAVPDQLGLKMQPATGERQFLVIDHIERPTAN